MMTFFTKTAKLRDFHSQTNPSSTTYNEQICSGALGPKDLQQAGPALRYSAGAQQPCIVVALLQRLAHTIAGQAIHFATQELQQAVPATLAGCQVALIQLEVHKVVVRLVIIRVLLILCLQCMHTLHPGW